MDKLLKEPDPDTMRYPPDKILAEVYGEMYNEVMRAMAVPEKLVHPDIVRTLSEDKAYCEWVKSQINNSEEDRLSQKISRILNKPKDDTEVKELVDILMNHGSEMKWVNVKDYPPVFETKIEIPKFL